MPKTGIVNLFYKELEKSNLKKLVKCSKKKT